MLFFLNVKCLIYVFEPLKEILLMMHWDEVHEAKPSVCIIGNGAPTPPVYDWPVVDQSSRNVGSKLSGISAMFATNDALYCNCQAAFS